MKLNLAANVTDKDGSETLAFSVSAIPVGATLTDGTQHLHVKRGQHQRRYQRLDRSANLTVTPAAGFTGKFKLIVNATATDHATLSTGAVTDSKTVSQIVDFIVGAAKDPSSTRPCPAERWLRIRRTAPSSAP